MSQQHEEGDERGEEMPPFDLSPGGVFIMDGGSEFSVKIAGLSDEQSTRVFALQQARVLLATDPTTDTMQIGQAQRQFRKPAAAPEVMDIYNLSLFILDGVDPWTDFRVPAPTPFRVAAVEDAGDPDAEMPDFD
jgi:hypothetical protein